MTTHEAIIVPVRVTALMANGAVRRQFWSRWQPDFTKKRYLSPEPNPLTQAAQPPATGVTVAWELPAALRDGTLRADGITEYPPVPNRWLLIRYNGENGSRSGTGWLVQSDCLREAATAPGDNSPYAVKTSDTDPTPVPKRIGRVIPLGSPLDDPAVSAPLTAIGPGLPTFALYQPYNLGVFSLHDPLTGLVDAPQDLSYLVFGWYSDSAKDPFADITDDLPHKLRDRLAALGWDCPVPTTTARTVYTGAVTGVAWNPDNAPGQAADEAPQVTEKPDKTPVHYAVADSSADGINALAHAYKPEFWQGTRLARLQALQYGLLHELDKRDGPAAAQARAQEGWFEPVAGGFQWDFTTPASKPGRPAVPVRPLPEQEQAWLADINGKQQAHDAAVRQLARRQERLYELWWYDQRLSSLIPSAEPEVQEKLRALQAKVRRDLAPGTKDTLAQRVKAEQEAVKHAGPLLRAQTPAELAKAIGDEIAALTKTWGRAPKGRPSRDPRPAFHNAREPVVLIKGAKAGRLLGDLGPVACRLAAETVTKADANDAVTPVKPGGYADAVGKIPGTLPTGLADAVLTEFATLDRHRTPTKVTFGSVEAEWGSSDRRVRAARRGLAGWMQPWTPLHLVWEAQYFTIGYHHHAEPAKQNWVYSADRHTWHGEGDAPEGKAVPRTVSGSLMLSPHAVLTISERLARINDEAPGQPKEFVDAVQDLLTHFTTGGTDLISQALDGFTEQLTGRVSRLRPQPDKKVADLLDGHHTWAPTDLQAVGAEPPKPEDPENWVIAPNYEPLRAGQLRLMHLFLVDRFGRGYEIVQTATPPDRRPAPHRSAFLIPDDKPTSGRDAADAIVHIKDPKSWQSHLLHLRPRLPQPVRLNFDFISRLSDTTPALNASCGDQVSAWIVPNYFDNALLCHAPDGTLLGELLPAGDGKDGKVSFERHHPDAPTLGQQSAKHPNLARFLNGLHTRSDPGKSLDHLLATIEQARLTIQPYRPDAGHPMLRMLGRPLALIRARLELEPDAEPIVQIKPSKLTANPPTAPYQTYTWPILLGSAASFNDGLVGYFDQSDYAKLYAVAPPEESPTSYIADRANGAGLALPLSTGRLVTLLADPWARTTATSHILPPRFLRLDPDAVTDALAAMHALFHVGPVLGSQRAVTIKRGGAADATVQAFTLPIPVVEAGEWAWLHADGMAGDVTAADTTARITPEFKPQLRTGLLRLSRRPPAKGM